MLNDQEIVELATLLADARCTGQIVTPLPSSFDRLDAVQADAVQDATAARLGTVGGYKVFQVGTGVGSRGVILAHDILTSPARAALGSGARKIELEVAFRIGRDLPGRADGRAYGADEVADAIEGAFAAFELLQSRLPEDPKPSPFAARADAMGNLGLVVGPALTDWRKAVHADLAVTLEIGGRQVVSRRGGHPSGDPFHPMVWLAGALAASGRGLRAGQIVTTGAFGGSHPIAVGEVAIGTVEGFAPIRFEFLA